MRYYDKKRLSLRRFLFCFFYTLLVGLLIFFVGEKITISTTNITNVKSIESYRIKTNEQNQEEEFVGTLTSYLLENTGTISLSCLEIEFATNDLTYQDPTFGEVKIVKANEVIPCGTIVKVSSENNKEFYGIVLDRNKNISKETLEMIKFFPAEDDFQKIIFKIERLGF